jgi:S1-C subfamily serine protease
MLAAAMVSFACNGTTPALDVSGGLPLTIPPVAGTIDSATPNFDLLESANLSLVESQTRRAAVKVIRPFESGHGSGTYMKMHGRLVVITAAHVVDGYTTMIIEGRNDERVIGSVAYADQQADLAVIITPRLQTRTPIPYRAKLTDTNLIGSRINYTGFPGRHDLLTIRGYVASLEREMIVTNMFGWFGSSGSGVFDQHGRFLGVVSGIDIGNWMIPLPLESLVWVAPAWEFDSEIVKVRVITAPPLEVFKSFPGARAPRRGGVRD